MVRARVLQYHVAGWEDCKYFKRALKHARFVADALASSNDPIQLEVRPEALASRDEYFAWLDTHRKTIKAPAKHKTSPAVWTDSEWIGGLEALVAAIERDTDGRIWESGKLPRNRGRAIVGVVMLVVSIALALGLILSDAPPASRLAVALPVTIGVMTPGQLVVGC